MGVRSTACKDSAFVPYVAVAVTDSKPPSPACPGSGTGGTPQGYRHLIAVSSLLSQAVPALLTPKAGSVGKLNLSHIHSVTPKAAHDF